MHDDVKASVDAKVQYFDLYLAVPDEIKESVDEFCNEAILLGEACTNCTEFEERFVSSGLSDRFMTLISQCGQRSTPMTKEQKRQSLAAAKEIIYENRKETAEYIADSAMMTARVELEGSLIEKNRERMIEDGTLDDHTRARNAIEDGGRLIGFLAKKFKNRST